MSVSSIDSPYAPLKNKNFRFFLLGRFFTTFAWNMQAVVVGWQIYELTRDPLLMGTTGLAEIIPFFAVALFGGHICDLFPRKNIIMISSICLTLSALFLLLEASHWIPLGHLGVWPIWGAIAVTGVVRAFIAPAMTAFFAQILPKELYARGVAWNSNAWQLGATTGPMAGGFIYGFLGVKVAYLTVVTSFFLGFCFFPLIRHYTPMVKVVRKEGSFEGSMEGVKFVYNNSLLLSVMALDMFAVLFGGATSMLPLFADQILKVGPEGVGLLRSAPFVGSIVMGLFLAYYPLKYNIGKKLLIAVSLFGLATICFALSTHFYLSLFFLFLTGVFDNVSVIIRTTIMQVYTPDHMRGRVSAVNSIFIGSSNEIGQFESGVAAKLMGVVPSVIFGGMMTLVVVLITKTWTKGLKNLDMAN